MPIFVDTSVVPYSVRDKLAPEKMKQLKVTQSQGHMLAPDPPVPPPTPDFPVTITTSGLSLHPSVQLTMNKRYDVSQKALDLQSLRYDPGTVDSRNSGAGEDRGYCLGGRLRDGNEGRFGSGPGHLSTFSFPTLDFLKTWCAMILI